MIRYTLQLPFDVRYAISTRILGYLYEVQYNIQSVWDKKFEPQNKFLLFSSGRSGSTLLLDLLHSDHSIYCDGELLKRKVLYPKQLIDIRSHREDVSTYGFKLLSYQLRDVQQSIEDKQAFLNMLVDEGYKIIHLGRENRLRQVVSIFYAMDQNNWHNRGKTSLTRSPIELDIDKLDTMLKGLEGLSDFENEILQNVSHLKINYETDLLQAAKHQTTVNRVCQFLDIPNIRSKTNLKKSTPIRWEDVITNFSEFEAYLLNSPYQKFLR